MWCISIVIPRKLMHQWCVSGEKEEEKIDKWKKMVKMEMKEFCRFEAALQ